MLLLKLVNKAKKLLRKLTLVHRLGALVLLFLGLVFILPALTQQPVTLNLLMTAPDAQAWQQGLVKDFQEKNPGIRINIVEGAECDKFSRRPL